MKSPGSRRSAGRVSIDQRRPNAIVEASPLKQNLDAATAFDASTNYMLSLSWYSFIKLTSLDYLY
jgi:hypothetical protein